MQAYTQTQVGEEIAVDTLISKHWQLIMRVTSSAASGWELLTASQPCMSAQGDLKRCRGLTAGPRTYRCFHTHDTDTHTHTHTHTYICPHRWNCAPRLTSVVGGRRTRCVWSLDTWKRHTIELWCIGAYERGVGDIQRTAVPANWEEDRA